MFSKAEVKELTIAWIVLGLCFSIFFMGSYRSGLGLFPQLLVVSLIGVGFGFVFHELAHKFVAQRYGYRAEFRLWKMGLIIGFATAVLTLFYPGFIFAAPGAVYILAYTRPREQGIISLAGPGSNLVLAGLFYFLAGLGGMAGLIGVFGFNINIWLAAFNLLPIGPLDGRAVMSWNTPVWVLLLVVAWGLLGLTWLGYIL
ncbi:MAG: site-2 protease family protein [Chloroflexota bacterium]